MQVKTVYILAMRSGFDQYLASEIAKIGAVRVVTEPGRADAVLTDHLGDSFEQRMDALFPAPKPEPKPTPKTEESKADSKAPSSDAKQEEPAPADQSVTPSRPVSSGISGKGNIFLVSRQNRAVLWSDFREPRSRQPKDMKRAADSVATDLKHALQPPDSGLK
jgi:hypothetical protein